MEKPIAVPQNDFCLLALKMAVNKSLKVSCLYGIGRIHSSFLDAFELADEDDIDSNKSVLPDDVYQFYSVLIKCAVDLGASHWEIGEAHY